MRTVSRGLVVPILAMALVPFLSDVHLPFANHSGKAAAQEAGFRNQGQAVSSAVHEAQAKTGKRSGSAAVTRLLKARAQSRQKGRTTTRSTTRSSTRSTTTTRSSENPGEAVSTAAQQAKGTARVTGQKVGPAVSGAVHEAQQAPPDRQVEAEAAGGIATDTSALGRGSSTAASTTVANPTQP